MLGAAAGAFAVIAVVAFVVEVTDDDPTGPGIAFNAILAVGALILGLRAPGPVRSACVTAIVLTVPLIWFFALFGNGDVTRDNVRFLYLLVGATYLVLYLMTWTKGRAILLAGALLVLASWITFEVAGSESNSFVPFQGEIDNSQTSGNFIPENSLGFEDTGDTTSATSATAMVIGLVFLGLGAMLDRRKLYGAATPFVAIGAFETIVGAVILGGNESTLLGGLLAIAAGAVVGVVGGHGDRRRATTWIGVITVFAGLVAVLVDIAPSSAAGVGGIALAFAVGLALIAWRLAPVLGEPDDGNDDPKLPPPVPPGGDSKSDDITEATTETSADEDSPAEEEAAA
ncbi:MAG: hypothetical protein WEB19_03645 [Acidimicrobiia bacterium]